MSSLPLIVHRIFGQLVSKPELRSVFIALGWLLFASAVDAQDWSDPLHLEQALTHLTPTAVKPAEQPLYLDCHRVAFGSAVASDPGRARARSELLDPDSARRLEVMARFFDALLADLNFAADSEAMAVAYVQFDRAKVRSELGQVAPLTVSELEAVYQQLMRQRVASQLGQQLTRMALAQAVDGSDAPPGELAQPESLPTPPESFADFDTLFNQARISAAQRRSSAELAAIEPSLRQHVFELLSRLRALAAAQQSVRAEARWRDLALDQSRTLYEQEVTADLGDAMSQQTRTRLHERQIVYCQTLAWTELQALTNKRAVLLEQ